MNLLRHLAFLAVFPFMARFALADGASGTAGVPGHAAGSTPEAKCAVDRLTRFVAGEKPVEEKLVFVYFSPADRDPPPGYRQRLARVMGNIQAFYADEMERHRLGRRSIRFDRDADGGLIVHDVKGGQPTDHYLGRNQSIGAEIARDSRPVLAAAGIDDEKETVIYFCNLRTEKEGRTTGIGPYHGTGSSVFAVKADGREVFRSDRLEAGKAVSVMADVAGAKQLELLTEDAGDGNRSAWSI